jgi:hypothetical protein
MIDQRVSNLLTGSAVSVECFLDIWLEGEDRPTVRWTSFNEEFDAYQGELLHKEIYTHRFLEAKKRATKTYDYSRLNLLWNHLVGICTA